MTRQELFTWIRQQHGTEPEYPWHDWNAVLRHNDNNKWYGVVLEVSADKLGLPEAGIIDVLNVKSDPLMIGSLRGQEGYFPAYHMNKEKWLSIQLGKPELDDAIKDLLSTKVGGCGIRYTVMIGGHESSLYNEDEKWFVEAKEQCL